MKKTIKWVLAFVIILLMMFIPYSFFQGKQSAIPKDQQIQMIQKETVLANNLGDSTDREKVERVQSDEERIHFLLLGTDERKDEPARSDTIVLATYFPNEGKMKLLSIPRDTKVMIPGKGTEKINAAHAIGGMDLVKDTVEDWSGIPIDHVAKVNFNGFKELINEAGGVQVDAQKRFSYGGYTFEEGKQKLNGAQALSYVRFRKNEDGDFGRIKRQQEVIQNTVSSVLSDFSLFSIPSYLNFYRKHVESDMSFGDMYHLAKVAYSNGVHFESQTVKTSSIKENGIWYEVADEDSKQASLEWIETRPSEILPSPHEEKEAIDLQANRISGNLDMP